MTPPGAMKACPTFLPGLLVLDPVIHRDSRGHFLESWSAESYAAHGIPLSFAQDSLSRSAEGVLRGLHLQWPQGQGKLVWVAEGTVLDIAVDLRRSSSTFGAWEAHELDAEKGRQLWIPVGFAHGFLVTRGPAVFCYKCSTPYSPANELSVRWDDPDLAIAWPTRTPILSEKDGKAPLLGDIPRDRLPS